MSVKENIIKIKENIALAALESGRRVSDIKLVAVSKRVTPERMQEAIECGTKSFGENYVQEFRQKITAVHGVEWHFIGQLQSNKVKYIFRDIYMLHSLDRLSLAKELDKRLSGENLVLKTLVQLNIGHEPQKGGIMPEDAEKFLTQVSSYEALDVCGLMCMPPFSNTREENVRDFAAAKKIFDDMLGAGFNMRYLSMGMSGDYMDAIKQGANIVRVGSAIFGERS
jgi:hypothetical protein